MSNYTTRTEVVGSFGVDSGTVMIIDPCYVLKDDRDALPPGTPYDQSTEYLRNVMPTCEAPYYGNVRPDGYRSDCGMVFSTLHGDGEYPIIAEFNSSGRVVRLIIDFDYEAEEEEEDDDWSVECDDCGSDITDQPQHTSERGHGILCSDCKDNEDEEIEQEDSSEEQ